MDGRLVLKMFVVGVFSFLGMSTVTVYLLFASFRFSVIVFSGIIVSTYDTLLYTKPQGYVPTIATYLRGTVPLVASAATFAAVTCAACNLRGKDDKVNYLIGGLSAGSVIGVAGKD